MSPDVTANFAAAKQNIYAMANNKKMAQGGAKHEPAQKKNENKVNQRPEFMTRRNPDFTMDAMFEMIDAVKVDGLMTDEVLKSAVDAGLPIYIIEELKRMLEILNSDVQFLVADSLLDYLFEGKKLYHGHLWIDRMLDELFSKADRYILVTD